MSKLIENENPNICYQIPESDRSYRLAETYITRAQFVRRIGEVSLHLKWSADELAQYSKHLWNNNRIVKHKLIVNSIVPSDFSMSLHDKYPTELFSYGIKQARGHPYVVRKAKTATDLNDIVDALYKYRLNKNTEQIKSIMDRDLNGLLFEDTAKLHFLNYPRESYNIRCVPGHQTKLMNKHNTAMKALHWGQRKLILSEMRFITKVIGELGINVDDTNTKIPLIYPGAAPGTHIMLLMEMFPQIVMYMWDPAIFIDNLLYTDIYRRTGNIEDVPSSCREFVAKHNGRIFICPEMVGDDWNQYINNVRTRKKEKNLEPEFGFFKDESLDWIKDNINVDKAMFISDIRLFTNNDILRYQSIATRSSYDPILTFISKHDAVADHHRDMELQKEWYQKSNIRFGLLKFKLDSVSKIGDSIYQEYPLGEIMLQSWGPYMSTESRLFVDNQNTKPTYYNTSIYGNMMKFFNKTVRHTPLGHEKLCDHEIHVCDQSGLSLTLEHVWRIIFTDQDSVNRISMDCLSETKIIYDFLSMYKKDVSIFDIIHVISDITKSLKLKTPINFNINNNYNKSRNGIKIRNHRSRYFQGRLDYTSIRTDFTPFPPMK
jgi:hypothetical protein